MDKGRKLFKVEQSIPVGARGGTGTCNAQSFSMRTIPSPTKVGHGIAFRLRRPRGDTSAYLTLLANAVLLGGGL